MLGFQAEAAGWWLFILGGRLKVDWVWVASDDDVVSRTRAGQPRTKENSF